MFCPLMSIYDTTGISPRPDATSCYEMGCAWWQVDKCILVTIASALGGIVNQLDYIRCNLAH